MGLQVMNARSPDGNPNATANNRMNAPVHLVTPLACARVAPGRPAR